MKINRANDYQLETQFAKEGDYNGRELVVQITDDGEVKNQTGVSLNLGWRHNSAGNSGLDPFSVVDASKGIFKITYPTEMLIAGDVTATIQVIENGKITLTRNFKITVEYNPINEDVIVSENSFTALQNALSTISKYDNKINSLENRVADVIQSADLDPNKDQELVDARDGNPTLNSRLKRNESILDVVKSWNLFDKSKALDGKVMSNNPVLGISTYANAIFSGVIPVESGKSYSISQKLTAVGDIFCFDGTVTAPIYNNGAICAANTAGGVVGTWGNPTGKILRTNKPISDGYFSTVVTILDPSIKFIAWHMQGGGYWPHTSTQFNELINSTQAELGEYRTSYTDFGWEEIQIKESALPPIKSSNEVFTVVKNGRDISVRTAFSESKDILNTWRFPIEDANEGLNLSEIYLVDKNAPSTATIGELFKSSSDDIAPLYLNGSYVGANHGFLNLITITANNHGKTDVDIGSVWNLSGLPGNFIIFDVINQNTLQIFSDFTGNQKSPTHYWNTPSGELTHLNGAVNVSSISFTGATKGQLYPNANNISVKLMLDNTEIIEDGVFHGNKFDLIEVYNITDIPSIQAYLKTLAGTPQKPNLSLDTLGGWVSVTNIFTHNRNGSITVNTGYNFLKDTNITFYGAIQSMTIGTKAYVPDVGVIGGLDLSTVVTQGTETFDFAKSTWLNPDKPPYRYHQFNGDLSKGMAIGYNTNFGVAKPSIRKNDTGTGNFNGASKKMYPYVKVGGAAVSGDYHEVVSFRVPLRVIDSDATCLYWYWIGEDVYLAFDYHKNIDKIIELPSYLAGKKIEQLDVHANTTIQSEMVSAKGIKVKIINNYGYGVIRLFD